MKKFTEQHKSIDNDVQNSNTNKTNHPVVARNRQMVKTTVADKAKQDVDTSKSTQNKRG
ncbi:hypothetical protein L5M43_02475 [Shewanella sp. SW36]|uniref:hypothetical protein n=1 Tax=Shewanella TaxID=22 RepID=UPI0021D97D82|nr:MULTISPECIES: hypothetical protein [unclassified Shewanella]MCU7974138.1 hypothetical protein [Shewanella sp. SW36]MCU7989748.1 hypothetical protein [Shewanella sp. SW1]MCU8019108.1 hypothetical protein [Shewanella sp. SM72]MCU8050174.1 hypothetical protein [Shewanella sp. SM43]